MVPKCSIRKLIVCWIFPRCGRHFLKKRLTNNHGKLLHKMPLKWRRRGRNMCSHGSNSFSLVFLLFSFSLSSLFLIFLLFSLFLFFYSLFLFLFFFFCSYCLLRLPKIRKTWQQQMKKKMNDVLVRTKNVSVYTGSFSDCNLV